MLFKKTYFKYILVDPELIQNLINIKSEIKNFVDVNKPFYFRVMPDHYVCLIHSIISQQISSKILNSIWEKLNKTVKKITPKNMLKINSEKLKNIGIPLRKIVLIREISKDIVIKKLSLDKLKKSNDKTIYEILTSYKGMGKWTVDMLMIFSYYKKNILPINDFGIKNGIKKLYCAKELNNSIINKIKSDFNNNLSLLSLILWKISNDSSYEKK